MTTKQKALTKRLKVQSTQHGEHRFTGLSNGKYGKDREIHFRANVDKALKKNSSQLAASIIGNPWGDKKVGKRLERIKRDVNK